MNWAWRACPIQFPRWPCRRSVAPCRHRLAKESNRRFTRVDFEQIPIQVGSSRHFGTPYILGQFLPNRPLRLWPGGVQGCWQLLAEGKSFCLVSEAFFDHFRIMVIKHGSLLRILCEKLDASFSQHAGKCGEIARFFHKPIYSHRIQHFQLWVPAIKK